MDSLSPGLKQMWKGMVKESGRYDFVFDKLEDENNDVGCPYCINVNSFDKEDCSLIEPVFKYFNGLDDFRTHALVFQCPKGHRFVLELDHGFEWAGQSKPLA